MIPIPGITPGPRLYIEIGMLVLILALGGATITYRALYKAEHTRVSEQLNKVAAETAQETSRQWDEAYSRLEKQRAEDVERGRKATQDAAARAAKAESALNKMRRDRNAEAAVNPCLDQPLSPATVERLRQLENGYRPGAGSKD